MKVHHLFFVVVQLLVCSQVAGLSTVADEAKVYDEMTRLLKFAPMAEVCTALRWLSSGIRRGSRQQACTLIREVNRRVLMETVGSWIGESATQQLRGFIRILSDAAKISSAFVIDVGANVGQGVENWNVLSKRTTWYLYDASPANIKVLQQKFSDQPNIHVHHTAVSNYSGTMSFLLPVDWNAGSRRGRLAGPSVTSLEIPLSRTEAKGVDLTAQLVNITVNTLDNLLQDVPLTYSDFVLLKVDIEGFDHLALLGARRLLHRVRMVVWECHVLQLASQGGPGTTHRDTEAYLLREFGMATFKLSTLHWMRFDGPYYDEIFDTPKHMDWSNCFSIRKTDPWYETFKANAPSCLSPHLYNLCGF